MFNTSHQLKSIVLLHGWGGSYASVWRENSWEERLVTAGYEVEEIDLPGHGNAERSHDPQGYADLASSIAQRLPNARPITAIGYSLGAKVLLEIAARNPDIFGTLVLAGLGANVFAPEKAGELIADVLEQGVNDATPATIRGFVSYGLEAGNDPLALAACLRRPPNPVITADRLAKIRCRTLVIAGDRDTVALPLEPLASVLPNHTLLLLKDIDHLGLPAAPEFADAVMRFLDSRA
ncbi:Pimeloyl-ACP methyl ester carboxylesterase [Collimonas sp. OK607]|uniref:alpha/beta fold hydrolase n=1 Tax=Collimonas sp. OK607 TaxID=1798194 RepID=UPI0008EA33C3|nr:alpha/beta hydrolase [Collimonas sp. OK607]SFB34609.1 Pimeloyl-ACP methyl ester carboxylesterase [Collimonas sp. OK607]